MRKRELVGRRSSSENNDLAKRQMTDESLPPSECNDYIWENELDKNKYFVGLKIAEDTLGLKTLFVYLFIKSLLLHLLFYSRDYSIEQLTATAGHM